MNLDQSNIAVDTKKGVSNEILDPTREMTELEPNVMYELEENVVFNKQVLARKDSNFLYNIGSSGKVVLYIFGHVTFLNIPGYSDCNDSNGTFTKATVLLKVTEEEFRLIKIKHSIVNTVW